MKAKIKYKMVNTDVYRELKEINEKLLDKCIELKAENEKLKKEAVYGYVGNLSNKLRALVFKDLNAENRKYKQALDEIEQYCIDTLELQDVHTIKQDILKYIKTAKGEGEE